MATAIKKSRAITNRDALPRVKSLSSAQKMSLIEAVGVVEAATTDDAGSTYIFASIPSNARISDLLLSCDAATSGAIDIGLYRSTVDGSAVVDADFFASAVSLASALNNSSVEKEADPADAGAGFGKADSEKPLWECLGLASDPGYLYDVVGTVTTAPGAAATIALKVQYGI